MPTLSLPRRAASRAARQLAAALLLSLPALGLAPGAAFGEPGPRLPSAQGQAQAPASAKARVIVRYKDTSELMRAQRASAEGRAQASAQGPRQAALLARRTGLAITDGFGLGPRTQVLFARGIGSAELAQRLRADPDIEHAEVDQRMRIAAAPNDPLYRDGQTGTPTVGQWYLRAPSSPATSAINAEAAWDITNGSAGVVVAVLDTGVRLDHPDLAGKLLPGYDFVSDVETANDGGGRDADPSDPGDWITAGENASGDFAGCGVSDSSWHGTQVAGLIGAATHNGIGMAGAGRNVMVLPVRVLGKCGGFTSDIVAGMRWAAGISSDPVTNPNPARVLNLSLGSSNSCSNSYQTAVNEIIAAGVVVVAAAGNDTGHAVNQPGNCAGALAVAGIRHIGSKVGYSNIGPEVAIAAPAGNCVNLSGDCLYPLLTTVNLGTTVPTVNSYSDSVNYSVGTSFATPLVAGTAALMLSANPSLTPTQVRSAIQATARTFPTTGAEPGVLACAPPSNADQLECYCTTTTCGAGMLNAAAAVANVATNPPTPVISQLPATVVAGDLVTFGGSGSTAFTGRSITAWQWQMVSGGGIATLNATNGVTTTVSTTGAGSFTLRLTVTDSAAITNSVNSTVIVLAPTTARLAASNTSPTIGTAVTLDGSGSTAATGSIASYLWEITSGGGLGNFSGGTTGATATLATTAAGTLTVRLTVTDTSGRVSSTTQAISVTAATAGGGGGGAASWPWLLLLALATALLPSRSSRR
ncbi:MAG: S8 family serine peptidase [Aquabacterium sp.]